MRTLAVCIAAAAVLSSAALAQVRSEMSYADLPETVRAGFEAHQPAAHPEKAVAVTEEGVTTYTLRDPQVGDNHSDRLNAAGEIFECSHDLALTAVPETVMTAVQAAYPSATVVDARVKYVHGETDTSEYHFHLSGEGVGACALFSGTGDELEDPHMAAHRN
jgi:hypothetical protein